MITLKQEEKIRILLKTGLSGNETAQLVGVSTDAVYAIRKMVEVIAELTEDQRNRIKALLDARVPARLIEIQMRIPVASIQAVRRYFYLHPDRFVGSKLSACPVCGAIRGTKKFHRETGTEEEEANKAGEKRLREGLIVSRVGAKTKIAMYRIIEDIVALGDLGVIVNPLFHNLLPDARTIVEKINGKTN